VNEFFRDIKYATRGLIRKPAFSAITVATLALGIGGNTAILTTAHTILFSPLPFPRSQELVRIQVTTTGPNGNQNAFNLRGSEIQELWQQGEQSPLSALVAGSAQNRTLTDGDRADLVRVAGVHGAWKSVLGVEPILGRWFSTEEEKRGDQGAAVVISTALWTSRYGGDKTVLGRAISLDHRSLVTILRTHGRQPRSFRAAWMITRCSGV